jgi:hypothetical protein
VGPARGAHEGNLRRRRLTIRFHGAPPPDAVTLDGYQLQWRFDGRNGVLETTAEDVDLDRESCFEARFDSHAPNVFSQGWKGFMARMESLQQTVNSISPARPIHPEERLTTRIAQTGNRLTRNPGRCREELLAAEHDFARLPRVLTEYHEACRVAKNHQAAAALGRAGRMLSVLETHPCNFRLRISVPLAVL